MGRPKKYNNVEEMQKVIDEYVKICDEKRRSIYYNRTCSCFGF